MKLRHVCDLEFLPVNVLKEGGDDAGYGRVRGERLNGKLRWRSALGSPSEDVTDLAGHAVITTDDGAEVLLTVKLMTLPRMHRGDNAGQLVLLAFATNDERYRWLTELHAVSEGPLRSPAGTVRFEVFAPEKELGG